MQGKKPKIAIVYHFFAHYRGPIISELLNSSEFDFYFIGDDRTNSHTQNQKLFDFQNNPRFLKVENCWFLKVFLWQKRISKILKHEQFDAVVFLGDWKYISTWLAVKKLKARNVPSFFWSHGLLNDKITLNNKIKLVFFSLFSNGGFVYAEMAKSIMLKSGFENRIEVVYNSLDFRNQISIIQGLRGNELGEGILNLKPYLILSGRLDARKRIELLLDAVKFLKCRGEKINVVLVGEGTHKSVLLNYAKELDIEKEVFFYGSCYDERILAQLYSNALVCVIPSAVGLSAIHALTYQTPVITNDDVTSHGPEVEAIIQGETGCFFKKDSHTSLAEAILYFKNLPDEDINIYRNKCLKMIEEKYNPVTQKSIFSKRLREVLEN